MRDIETNSEKLDRKSRNDSFEVQSDVLNDIESKSEAE